jgi:hypothetical protein
MKKSLILWASLLASVLMFENGCVVAAGPPGPPPAPIVEAYGVAPFPDAVWIGGGWDWHPEHRRYEWRHGEWRHRG